MKKATVILMMLFTAISPLFRGLFFSLEASAFLAVLALLSFIYFMTKLTRKEDIFYNKWLLIFGGLLILAYGLAFINSVNPRYNFEVLVHVTGYLIFAIVLYDYYQDKKREFSVALMAPMVISAFVNASTGLMAITGAFKFLNDTLNNGRIGGTFQYANIAAVYYMMAVIFSLTLMYLTDKPIYRVLLSGINTVILLAMLLTRSRGGYIVGFSAVLLFFMIQAKGYRLKTFGLFLCSSVPAFLLMKEVSNQTASQDAKTMACLLIISFMAVVFLAAVYECMIFCITRVKKKLRPPVILSRIIQFTAICLVIASVFLLWDRIIVLIPGNITNRFAKLDMSEPSVYRRIEYYKDALKLISKNWLFGVGGGGWEVLNYGFQETYYVSRTVHNHYLEVFVDAGILGFIAFTSAIILAVFYFIREIYKAENLQKRIILAGLFSGFLALAAHATFDFDLSFVSMTLLLWVMIVLAAPGTNNRIKLKSRWAAPLLSVTAAVLILFNTIISLAAFNAKKGLNLTLKYEPYKALTCYEEAVRLDPYNYKYSYEISKLCRLFGEASKIKENKEAWYEAALSMAERSISQNPYLPESNRLLTDLYNDMDMPLKALESAEKLVSYQPYYDLNYEILARSYLKAAKYYSDNNDYETANELLKKCIDLEPPVKAKLKDYKEEASLLLTTNLNNRNNRS